MVEMKKDIENNDTDKHCLELLNVLEAHPELMSEGLRFITFTIIARYSIEDALWLAEVKDHGRVLRKVSTINPYTNGWLRKEDYPLLFCIGDILRSEYDVDETYYSDFFTTLKNIRKGNVFEGVFDSSDPENLKFACIIDFYKQEEERKAEQQKSTRKIERTKYTAVEQGEMYLKSLRAEMANAGNVSAHFVFDKIEEKLFRDRISVQIKSISDPDIANMLCRIFDDPKQNRHDFLYKLGKAMKREPTKHQEFECLIAEYEVVYSYAYNTARDLVKRVQGLSREDKEKFSYEGEIPVETAKMVFQAIGVIYRETDFPKAPVDYLKDARRQLALNGLENVKKVMRCAYVVPVVDGGEKVVWGDGKESERYLDCIRIKCDQSIFIAKTRSAYYVIKPDCEPELIEANPEDGLIRSPIITDKGLVFIFDTAESSTVVEHFPGGKNYHFPTAENMFLNPLLGTYIRYFQVGNGNMLSSRSIIFQDGITLESVIEMNLRLSDCAYFLCVKDGKYVIYNHERNVVLTVALNDFNEYSRVGLFVDNGQPILAAKNKDSITVAGSFGIKTVRAGDSLFARYNGKDIDFNTVSFCQLKNKFRCILEVQSGDRYTYDVFDAQLRRLSYKLEDDLHLALYCNINSNAIFPSEITKPDGRVKICILDDKLSHTDLYFDDLPGGFSFLTLYMASQLSDREKEMLALLKLPSPSCAEIDAYFAKYASKKNVDQRRAEATQILFRKAHLQHLRESGADVYGKAVQRTASSQTKERARNIIEQFFPELKSCKKISFNPYKTELPLSVKNTIANLRRKSHALVLNRNLFIATALATCIGVVSIASFTDEKDKVGFGVTANNISLLGGGDPRVTDGVLFMNTGLRVPEIISTELYDEYLGYNAWVIADQPHYVGSQKDLTEDDLTQTYTWTLTKGISGQNLVALPFLLGAEIVEVEGTTSQGETLPLDVEKNRFGGFIADLDGEKITSIKYTQERSSSYNDLSDISQTEYDDFKTKFQQEHGDAESQRLFPMPDFVKKFLDSIENLRPVEKLTAIRDFLWQVSVYDYKNAEIEEQKRTLGLGGRINMMQSRANKISNENPNDKTLKDKKLAGICWDFSALSTAMLREAGFLAQVHRGYLPDDEEVKTSRSHAVTAVIWPVENEGSYKTVSLDATPIDSYGEKPSDDSQILSKEELQNLIDHIFSKELFLLFLVVSYLLYQKDHFKLIPLKRFSEVTDDFGTKSQKSLIDKSDIEAMENSELLLNESVLKLIDGLINVTLWSGVEIEQSNNKLIKYLKDVPSNYSVNAENIYAMIDDFLRSLAEKLHLNQSETCNIAIRIFNGIFAEKDLLSKFAISDEQIAGMKQLIQTIQKHH
ncbi:hypothetical protein A2335_03045 [Candidatus Peregrinibacteria bacterium RIFOXYB2_FULL_32_7]|nr:MAG: hypothetical protein A2335_03045 [Candidatus Peregrinibacteria bacterium RIFOXYB2_FULL_32_7]